MAKLNTGKPLLSIKPMDRVFNPNKDVFVKLEIYPRQLNIVNTNTPPQYGETIGEFFRRLLNDNSVSCSLEGRQIERSQIEVIDTESGYKKNSHIVSSLAGTTFTARIEGQWYRTEISNLDPVLNPSTIKLVSPNIDSSFYISISKKQYNSNDWIVVGKERLPDIVVQYNSMYVTYRWDANSIANTDFPHYILYCNPKDNIVTFKFHDPFRTPTGNNLISKTFSGSKLTIFELESIETIQDEEIDDNGNVVKGEAHLSEIKYSISSTNFEQSSNVDDDVILGTITVDGTISYSGKKDEGKVVKETTDTLTAIPIGNIFCDGLIFNDTSSYVKRVRNGKYFYGDGTFDYIEFSTSATDEREYNAVCVSAEEVINTNIFKYQLHSSKGEYIISNLQAGNFNLNNVDMTNVAEAKEKYYLVNENATIFDDDTNKYRLRKDLVPSKDLYLFGALLSEDAGEIILYDNWRSGVDGLSNIEVEFESKTEGHADTINKCTFGTLFGTGGSKNRMFVSGNNEQKNTDWHTGETENDGNFTYFPDDSYNNYGTDATALKGYGIVSDGKLLAIKEDGDEPSIYYRTGDYRTQTISEVDTIQREIYPMTITNVRQGCSNPWLIADFCGDVLFVGKSGQINGLDVADITYNSSKVAHSRSSLIDKSLREMSKEEIDDSRLFVDIDRLYYSTPDCTYTTCYEKPYEWFKIDKEGITAISRLRSGNQDRVLFGNAYGDVYENSNDFIDIETFPIQLSQNVNYVSNITDVSCSFIVSKDIINILAFGLTKDEFESYKRDYKNLEPETKTSTLFEYIYQELLYSYNNHIGVLKRNHWKSDFSMKVELFGLDNSYGNNVILDVLDIDFDTQSIIIDKSGLDFSTFVQARLISSKDVKCYYITAPFTAGMISSKKTIWSYTINSDTDEQNVTTISKASNEKTLDSLLALNDVNPEKRRRQILEIIGRSYSNDGNANYYDYSFSNISFSKKVLPYTYTMYSPYSVSFICFRMSNEENSNSVLSSMQFTYSVPNNKAYGKD